jgi:hypothetical protein
MAGDSRTLKLSILADVDNLTKNLKKASVDTDNFGDKLTKFGSVAVKAFAVAAAAATAYAIKIGIDGVKAAIEDEAAQAKLATTLRNATGATDAQIASTEKYLTVLALQTAKSDEELRPALERLALSTNNVGEAQKLLEVSTRVSVNSGIELGTVATAIAKAQDGNTTSLGKLGIGLSAAEVKGKSFAEILAMINKIYPDLGANTDTAAFKMAQLKIGFEEAKESIGFALLPTLTSLINFLNISAIPAVNAFIDGLMGNYGMVDSLNSTEQGAFAVGASINTLSKSIAAMAIVFTSDGSTSLNGFIRILQFLADTANVVVTIIKELVSFIVEMSNQVISFLNLFGAGIQKIKSIQGTAFAAAFGTQNFATGGAPGAIGGGGGFSAGGRGAGGGAGGSGGFSGGSGSGSGSGTMGGGGRFGASAGGTGATSLNNLVDRLTGISEKFTDLTFLVETGGISRKAGTAQLNQLTREFDVLSRQADRLVAAQPFNASPSSAGMLTVNFNGVVGDGESVKRSLVELFNDSEARGTLGATSFAGL